MNEIGDLCKNIMHGLMHTYICKVILISEALAEGIFISKVPQLFQQLAESLTEQEYDQNLQNLKKSDVWTKNPRFQRYLENEWLKNDRHKVCFSVCRYYK